MQQIMTEEGRREDCFENGMKDIVERKEDGLCKVRKRI